MVRPPRQYRCNIRNAAINGMMATSAPVTITLKVAAPPLPMIADMYQVRSPTVSG